MAETASISPYVPQPQQPAASKVTAGTDAQEMVDEQR